MRPTIPTTSEVAAALAELGHAQVQRLSALSGVSFTTLWSIRSGERGNPGIETVRAFMPLIKQVRSESEKVA